MRGSGRISQKYSALAEVSSRLRSEPVRTMNAAEDPDFKNASVMRKRHSFVFFVLPSGVAKIRAVLSAIQ